MFELGVFGIVSLLLSIAGVVVFFWLIFTAIRALNVYIAKNDPSLRKDRSREEQVYDDPDDDEPKFDDDPDYYDEPDLRSTRQPYGTDAGSLPSGA